MKQYVSFVVISLFIARCSFLYSHGFHKDTIIYCRAGQAIQSLGQIIDRVKKNKCKYVTSYDQRNHTYIDKRARAAGFAQVPFYCALSFNNEPFADIICSPTQHFYRLFDQKWIPACDLHIGDKLLSKKMGSVKVTDIVFVEERLQVYTIQVKDTHTFLVGSHGIVAHNIILPIAAALGVTIPFSTGCGSGLGVVFGPVGFIGGILLGVGCGLLVNACFKERYVEYSIALQGEHVSNYVLRNEKQGKEETEAVKKNKDAKAERLPKEGSFPFLSPKTKDGKIPKSRSGAYIDKKGNEWKWDSRKEEWDVSNKNGHWNINVYGDQTHRGTHPKAQSHTSKSYKKGS